MVLNKKYDANKKSNNKRCDANKKRWVVNIKNVNQIVTDVILRDLMLILRDVMIILRYAVVIIRHELLKIRDVSYKSCLVGNIL